MNYAELPECNSEMTSGDLCEADQILPDGNKRFEIDNCYGFDVFKCLRGIQCHTIKNHLFYPLEVHDRFLNYNNIYYFCSNATKSDGLLLVMKR